VRLCINGEERTVEGVRNVAELLDKFGIGNRILVVELNRNIVDRARYAETELADGDRLEIVHFVGGG